MSANELASASALFAGMRSRLIEKRHNVEAADHPTAGASLRHYLILTECPDVATALGLSENERFWSRYYWLARFAREWKAVERKDAGLEQHVFKLLESADRLDEVSWRGHGRR